MHGMNHTEHGDRAVATRGEILRTVVGSGVHGLAIAGTDDHDEMGVYIEPPSHVVGLREPVRHYVFRTQPEGARSGPGDTDLVSYSLHKYLRLATKGNPTALLPLYAPADSIMSITPLGEELRALASSVLSRAAVHRFLGYLDSQVQRLLGNGRHGAPNRPELVALHGYDVKYASHALRLAYQGLEVARDGRLTLPMPEPERARVLAVKRGDVRRLDDVLAEIADVRTRIEAAVDDSPLPAEPDVDAISAWAVSAHRRQWGWA
jgi:predicted nucleotidyltransferase